MNQKTIHITLRASLFMAILGLIAWVSGIAFIFPSLGPSAYVLAFDEGMSSSGKEVIGGHVCGILGGLFSYHIVVNPYSLDQLTGTFSEAGLWLALGAVLALAITIFLMLLFQASHPPACATTLIVSLGILPGWFDGLIILMAVTVLYVTYLGYNRLAKKLK